MAPEKDKDRKAPRQEFEVAYYTKELGRSLQRELLARRLADLSGSHRASRHGEEASPDTPLPPPPEDRAG